MAVAEYMIRFIRRDLRIYISQDDLVMWLQDQQILLRKMKENHEVTQETYDAGSTTVESVLEQIKGLGQNGR